MKDKAFESMYKRTWLRAHVLKNIQEVISPSVANWKRIYLQPKYMHSRAIELFDGDISYPSKYTLPWRQRYEICLIHRMGEHKKYIPEAYDPVRIKKIYNDLVECHLESIRTPYVDRPSSRLKIPSLIEERTSSNQLQDYLCEMEKRNPSSIK